MNLDINISRRYNCFQQASEISKRFRYFQTLIIGMIIVFMPFYGYSQEEEFGGDTPPEITDSECETPNVLLLLDRSGSMLDDDKWGQATRAITDVFVPYFDTLRFGLMTFPTTGSCGVTEGELAISIGDTDGADLEAIYQSSTPTDMALTPLSEALRLGQVALEEVAIPQRRSFMILLTDGIETCAPEALEDSAPIASARLAADAGINTYVIGFGSLVKRSTLREMARVGGTEQERLVSDESQLTETLTTIIESATTEICDRLDNDCDGRIDEGLECEQSCNSQVMDCPCDNNQDCVLGETCVEGLCEPEACEVLCDVGFVCSNNTCVRENGTGQNANSAGNSEVQITDQDNLNDLYAPVAGQETMMNNSGVTSGQESSSCEQTKAKNFYILVLLFGLFLGMKKRFDTVG